MIGFCAGEDLEKQSGTWRHMASRLRLEESQGLDVAKLERYYANRPKCRDPEFRIRVRSHLVRGWKSDDTEHDVLLYSTRDERLIRDLKRLLEAIRKAYVELFPPMEPVITVSAVRVCKDEEEYGQYGDPPWSGGYWNAEAEELVFFDYGDVGMGRRSGERNSRVVLYHEAFHQYVYYSPGKLAAHDWFNAGHGDYFSRARSDGTGQVSQIGVNPWRIAYTSASSTVGSASRWRRSSTSSAIVSTARNGGSATPGAGR